MTPTEIINSELPEHIRTRFIEEYEETKEIFQWGNSLDQNFKDKELFPSAPSMVYWMVTIYTGRRDWPVRARYWYEVYLGERSEEVLNKLIEK